MPQQAEVDEARREGVPVELFSAWRRMKFLDEYGQVIQHTEVEREEQLLALRYVCRRHRVLELGARYGTVSCAIQLMSPRAHTAVEPDARVWGALKANLASNCANCDVLCGFVSRRPLSLVDDGGDSYGTRSIPADVPNSMDHPLNAVHTAAHRDPPSHTLEQLERGLGRGRKFNVLVADCEGYLGDFLSENPQLYDRLELLIFERDAVERCDYETIRATLAAKKFVCIQRGLQNVWLREGRTGGVGLLSTLAGLLSARWRSAAVAQHSRIRRLRHSRRGT